MKGLWSMMFNTTFNNISAISKWVVLLVEEIRVYGENQRPAANHCQTLSRNIALIISGIFADNVNGDMH